MLSALARRRAVAAARPAAAAGRRSIATLASNPHIYVFPVQGTNGPAHILSLLPTSPPAPELAVGTTTHLPPTPQSFAENPRFVEILQAVLAEHAHHDPSVIADAYTFASTAGSAAIFRARQTKLGGSGAGGASEQGGVGGGGVGGWVHLSDKRCPPDFGRIAWPEDIFGSLEVDGQGRFVGDHGNYQQSGTYRIVTRDGILGLSEFLTTKLAERLRQEERNIGGQDVRRGD